MGMGMHRMSMGMGMHRMSMGMGMHRLGMGLRGPAWAALALACSRVNAGMQQCEHDHQHPHLHTLEMQRLHADRRAGMCNPPLFHQPSASPLCHISARSPPGRTCSSARCATSTDP
eukprot:350415-Chlamydomonas_euryale.AAC.1